MAAFERSCLVLACVASCIPRPGFQPLVPPEAEGESDGWASIETWAEDGPPETEARATPGCGALSECPAGYSCEQGSYCVGDTGGEVLVPTGMFYMGCNPAVLEDFDHCNTDEKPQHLVALSAYAVDRFEVTWSEYLAFLREHDNACETPETPCYREDGWGSELSLLGGRWVHTGADPSRPVADVTWYGAEAYCAWRGKRLCTEAEWERAARGGCETLPPGVECAAAMRTYPWGDSREITCGSDGHAVFKDETSPCDSADTLPVGSTKAGVSPYGAFDLAGNVREWVQDWYHPKFYDDVCKEGCVDPANATPNQLRVRRGGSVEDEISALRSGYRGGDSPANAYGLVGFRCCRDVD